MSVRETEPVALELTGGTTAAPVQVVLYVRASTDVDAISIRLDKIASLTSGDMAT